MQKFNIAIAVGGMLAGGALAVAPTATVSDPLSQCIVTGVHGLANSDPTVFTTAYVDVSCPSSDD
jgi:hypothetical protein